MKKTLQAIIENNTPEEATTKILELFAREKGKDIYIKDDVEEAYKAGQKFISAHIGYEYSDESYAYTKPTKTFKEWFHQYSVKNKIKYRNIKIIKILYEFD
jgi:hypothetical protein